jgi:hypothetical protein
VAGIGHLPTHLNSREIADRVHFSANTVRLHITALYQTLAAANRADAVEAAGIYGLLSLSHRRAQDAASNAATSPRAAASTRDDRRSASFHTDSLRGVRISADTYLLLSACPQHAWRPLPFRPPWPPCRPHAFVTPPGDDVTPNQAGAPAAPPAVRVLPAASRSFQLSLAPCRQARPRPAYVAVVGLFRPHRRSQ